MTPTRGPGCSRRFACIGLLMASLAAWPGAAPARAQMPPSQPDGDWLPDAMWLPRRVAELQMLDKVTARVSVLRVAVDRPAQFGTLTIRIAACFGRPPDEVPDAAAWMEIADSRRAPAAAGAAGQTVFRGWMFANAPGVSMLEHPVYDVRVLDCRDGA
jgi:hypothetical protein